MKYTLLLVTLMAFTQGCKEKYVSINEGSAPGVRVARDSPHHVGIQYNTVQIIDRNLAQWRGPENTRFSAIAVEETNAKLSPANTISAWALLRNRTNVPIQIETRTTFFAHDKSPLEPPTAWTRQFLQPNSVLHYKSLSQTQVGQVGYYLIEVRQAR